MGKKVKPRKQVNKKRVRKKHNAQKRFTRNTSGFCFWFDWRSALEEGGIDEEGCLNMQRFVDSPVSLDHTQKLPNNGVPISNNVLELNREWLIQLELDTYNEFKGEYEQIPRYIVTPVCNINSVTDIYKEEKQKLIDGRNPKHVLGVSWGIRPLSGKNKRFLETVEEKYIRRVA